MADDSPEVFCREESGFRMKYFVLNPSTNTPYGIASRAALKAYADSIMLVNKRLHDDIYKWLAEADRWLDEERKLDNQR